MHVHLKEFHRYIHSMVSLNLDTGQTLINRSSDWPDTHKSFLGLSCRYLKTNEGTQNALEIANENKVSASHHSSFKSCGLASSTAQA